MSAHRRRSARVTRLDTHATRVVAFAVLLAAPWLAGLPVGLAQDDGLVRLVAKETDADIRPGQEAELRWTLVSDHPTRAYTVEVRLEAAGDNNWGLGGKGTVGGQTLHPGGSIDIRYTVSPHAKPDPRTLELELFVLVYNGTDDFHRLTDTATVRAVGTDLVLGTWQNPLGPPLDNMWGTFLLNALAWLVISFLAMWAVNPTLKLFTARTKTDVDDHIVKILHKPLFLVLFTFGVKQSLEVFPLPIWFFDLLDGLYRFVLVAALVYVAYRLWQEVVLIIGRRVAKKTESELDDRLLPVLEKVGGIIIVVIGIFYIIDSLGVNLTVFAAGGVLVSMVIAFAAQDTLSNFFSGVHLLLDQPFQEGDWVVLDSGELTTVTKIGLRSTELYHVANHESIIVPNNLIASNRIINILKPDTKSKVRVDVGVAYGTDVQKVMDMLLDIAEKHPLALHDADHQPFVRFQGFGASSLDFSIHFWVKEVLTRWAAASDARAEIDRRFAAEGIEIPFPQRVIWNGREEAERNHKGNGSGGGASGSGSILDHPKVKRDASPRQPSLAEETGAEPGSSVGAPV